MCVCIYIYNKLLLNKKNYNILIIYFNVIKKLIFKKKKILAEKIKQDK